MPRGDKGQGRPYSKTEIMFIRDNSHKGIDWLVANMYNRSAASITNRSWRSRISIRKGGPSMTVISIKRREETTKKHRWAIHGWAIFPKKLGYKTIRKMVMERDNYTCVYCGSPAEEVDHIVPKQIGGHDYPTNLAAACKKCNYYKSTNCVDCPRWRQKRGI